MTFSFALVFALLGSGLIFMSVPASQASALTTINLGSSANFGVIAGTYIETGATNTITGSLGAGGAITTGATNTITGNLYAGGAITTEATNTITGNLYAVAAITTGASNTISGTLGHGAAFTNGAGTTFSGTVPYTQAELDLAFSTAKADLASAMSDSASISVSETVSALIDGSSLSPGVYSAAGTYLTLTGTLTLDAGGDSNAVFIIKSPTYLELTADSKVLLTNGARASNVFFITGTHMLVGAKTILKGNVLATTHVLFGADVQVEGHIFSKASYVKLGADSTITPPAPSPEPSPPNAVLPPALGSVTPTATGFTATITNHDPGYTWSATATSGSVSLSGAVITVTGLTPSTSATVTITFSKTGSETGSLEVSSTSLPTPAPISPASPPASTSAPETPVQTPAPSASSNPVQTPPLSHTSNPEQTLPTVTPELTAEPVVPVTEITQPEGTISGSTEEITIVSNASQEALIASGSDWEIEFAVELIGGQSEPIPDTLLLDFQLGSLVKLSGTDLNPKAKVSVYVFSEPTFVGELETLADGSFATSMLLPASILPGNHTLQLLTTDLDGNQIVLNIPITVSGKVTVGTFKGYLAIYTKDLMGQRLSARVDGKWLVQDPITKYKNFNYSRQIRSVGVGYEISVDLYLNSNFFRTDVITSR